MTTWMVSGNRGPRCQRLSQQSPRDVDDSEVLGLLIERFVINHSLVGQGFGDHSRIGSQHPVDGVGA
jgi:hypothetical protein